MHIKTLFIDAIICLLDDCYIFYGFQAIQYLLNTKFTSKRRHLNRCLLFLYNKIKMVQVGVRRLRGSFLLYIKKLTILQKWRDPCILFTILFSLILFFLVKNLFASSTNNQKLLQQVP